MYNSPNPIVWIRISKKHLANTLPEEDCLSHCLLTYAGKLSWAVLTHHEPRWFQLPNRPSAWWTPAGFRRASANKMGFVLQYSEHTSDLSAKKYEILIRETRRWNLFNPLWTNCSEFWIIVFEWYNLDDFIAHLDSCSRTRGFHYITVFVA